MMKVRSGWREDMPTGQMWAVLRVGLLVSGLIVSGTSGVVKGGPGKA